MNASLMQKAFGISMQECLDIRCESNQIVLNVQTPEDKLCCPCCGSHNVVRDVEFDLSIVESTNTAAYREVANAFLMQIWQSGQISLEQMLQTGSFPFSDELLQSIQSQKEQVNQGQLPQGVSPQLMQEAASQGNPETQDKVQQMLQQQPNAEQ